MNSENDNFGKEGGDEAIEPKEHERIGSVKRKIGVQVAVAIA